MDTEAMDMSVYLLKKVTEIESDLSYMMYLVFQNRMLLEETVKELLNPKLDALVEKQNLFREVQYKKKEETLKLASLYNGLDKFKDMSDEYKELFRAKGWLTENE